MKIVNQQLIRSTNLKQIYTLIDKNISISRARLAKLTQLSKTTVSSLVDELIANGYVVDCGVSESLTQGRKPNILHVNSRQNRVAVISWRRARLDLALIDTDNTIIMRRELPLEEQEDAVEKIFAAFDDVLLPACKDARLLGVCIVVPGMVDAKNKSILSTVIGVSAQDNVVQRLAEHFCNYSLSILNDTACFAYAERMFARITEPSFAYINISKGVGACLFEEGRMLRGAGAMATQFGHYSIDRNGPSCACGNRGCLERMVGESFLTERASECGVTGIVLGGPRLLFSDISQAARDGNEKARELIRRLAEDMAYGLSNLITMFNPALIVIGGTGVKLGECFLSDIRTKLAKVGFQEFVSRVQLRYAHLGPDAELQGAAQYYIDFHHDFTARQVQGLFLG